METVGTWLRIEVLDADPCPPQPRTPAELDESGFGFVLVEALADKWGVSPASTGKTVWVELDTSSNRISRSVASRPGTSRSSDNDRCRHRNPGTQTARPRPSCQSFERWSVGLT